MMIDIESMSLHPHRALILSIGLVEFDPCSTAGLQIGIKQLIVPFLGDFWGSGLGRPANSALGWYS
jgi:hypothetical protein